MPYVEVILNQQITQQYTTETILRSIFIGCSYISSTFNFTLTQLDDLGVLRLA